MLLVSCEDIGLGQISERFCGNKEEVRIFLEEQTYNPSVIEDVLKNNRHESTFDLITVEDLTRNRHKKGSRSRADVLAINASILATVIAKYPNPARAIDLIEESPAEISERTLNRYISDWETTGMISRLNGGYIQLTKLGEQSFIIQAQQNSLHRPV